MKVAGYFPPSGPKCIVKGSKYVGAADVARHAWRIVALLKISLSTREVLYVENWTTALEPYRRAQTKLANI